MKPKSDSSEKYKSKLLNYLQTDQRKTLDKDINLSIMNKRENE